MQDDRITPEMHKDKKSTTICWRVRRRGKEVEKGELSEEAQGDTGYEASEAPFNMLRECSVQ